MNDSRRNQRRQRGPADPSYRLPPAAPGRADFHLVRGQRHVLLVPASSRGAWFLEATPLADPAALIPRIGAAHLLRADYAAALLPQLALHFRLRCCLCNPRSTRGDS